MSVPSVIEKSAENYYNNTEVLGNGSYRNWLPMAKLSFVAGALGRELDNEDLAMMAKRDGDLKLCSACGREFQPVRFVNITRRFTASIVSEGCIEAACNHEDTEWCGSLIVKGRKTLCFCGYFFSFDPHSRGEHNYEKYFFSRSCLGVAYTHEANRDPGTGRSQMPMARIDAEVAIEALEIRWRRAATNRMRVMKQVDQVFASR